MENMVNPSIVSALSAISALKNPAPANGAPPGLRTTPAIDAQRPSVPRCLVPRERCSLPNHEAHGERGIPFHRLCALRDLRVEKPGSCEWGTAGVGAGLKPAPTSVAVESGSARPLFLAL